MKSPAFQFYPDDFLGGKPGLMTAEEIGVYVLLLCLDWNQTGFAFHTNSDHERVAKWCKIRKPRLLKMWEILGECFVERDGRMYNPRLDLERQKQAEYSAKMSENGKLGGRPKKSRGKADVKLIESTPSPSPITTTTEILKATPSAPPDERVDQVLDHYRERHPRRRPGSTKDKGAIKRALKQYSVEDLCAAIDGNAADPWHFERAKHELTYVLRDSGKIDQFIALATTPTPALAGSSPAVRTPALADEYAVFDDLMRVVNAAGGYRNLGPEWHAAQSEPVRRAISAMGGLKSLANADEIGLRIKRKTFAEALAAAAHETPHDTPREATA